MPLFPNAHKGGGPAIGVAHEDSLGLLLGPIGATAFSATGSTAWPTASLSVLIPLWLSEQVTVAQLGWTNGATVSGNVDMGIYNQDGVLLLSTGSVVQATASALQLVNVTDTPIGPGLVYLALSVDNTTATIERMTTTGGAIVLSCFGAVQVAPNFPLAATVTFAVVANDYVPHMALFKQAVV